MKLSCRCSQARLRTAGGVAGGGGRQLDDARELGRRCLQISGRLGFLLIVYFTLLSIICEVSVSRADTQALGRSLPYIST